MDRAARELERQASAGDPQAAARHLWESRVRTGKVHRFPCVCVAPDGRRVKEHSDCGRCRRWCQAWRLWDA